MVIRPEVGGMKPVTMRIVVDLPAPLGPRKPSTSPRSTVKETSFTATFGPKALVRFSTLIMHPSGGAPRSDGVPLCFYLALGKIRRGKLRAPARTVPANF